ncbi:hypothetical protein ACIA3K_01370 [Micromonospora sp. NPDC051543]|uniref:hypothetical protein n=1 Tax=Micromonospora sp. NPDC051543 TaxID=3364287 RepID=UPI0037B7B17F
MPPRRRPRSWLAGRLRSVAGAVQRLAGRVDNPTAEPERPAEPPRRLGEPPQHWVDLVAAHAPGLLRELDVDLDQAAPTRNETPPGAAPTRRPDRSGDPVDPAFRPVAGRTHRPVAGRTGRPTAAHGRLGDPHPRARPGGAGDHVHPGLEAGGPGHADGGSERRLPIIRPAIPDGSTSSSGTARSDGSASTNGSASAASVGRPFRAPGVAHPGEAVATPGTASHLPPTPEPPGERADGFGTSERAYSRRSAPDATTSQHGRGGGRMGGPSWPALPDEPAGPARLGEHPAEGHPRPHAGHHLEQQSDGFPEHQFRGRSRQSPEHRASRLPDQQPTGRYGEPERPDQHDVPRRGQRTPPDRDQRADNPYADGRRGGEVGWWDAGPGYGTGTAEVDSAGRWPVSAPFASAAFGPGVDPWPALPDDGPLWTVPGAALDAGHERRLDREQAGG